MQPTAGATERTHRFFRELDLPVLVEAVDSQGKIRAIIPEIDDMLGDGLITLEKAEVIAYRAGAPGRSAP
jgi:hypothetical protein